MVDYKKLLLHLYQFFKTYLERLRDMALGSLDNLRCCFSVIVRCQLHQVGYCLANKSDKADKYNLIYKSSSD